MKTLEESVRVFAEMMFPEASKKDDMFTSKEAEKSFSRKKVCRKILDILDEHQQKTSREIAMLSDGLDNEQVKKRLSDLKALGLIHVAGIKVDETTGRKCSMWNIGKRGK